MARPRVQSGLDVFTAPSRSLFPGMRVGVLCHQASVNAALQPILSVLQKRGAHVVALFAPEHGFWGTAQDQVAIDFSDLSPTLPVHSLYGNQRAPTAVQLAGLDVLVCDLQDVGARYYTFIWTMALAMQSCAMTGKKFVVLDRPNPLDGQTLEGPVLNMNFASFVGLYPLPVRHGLTIGEIALWLNSVFQIDADLEVVAMKGWRRKMSFEETGLPWVLPSPNMPTVDTAFVYPGACLVEGTQLSEGRGTTRPFEMMGAPFIDPDRFTQALNARRLPGVQFRACRFEPTFHKFAGETCGGAQWHVTDRKRFKPFLTGLGFIQTAYALYPNAFAWRPPPYEYEKEKMPFDILCGNNDLRGAIERGDALSSAEKRWSHDLAAFARARKPFLLYN